VRRTARDLLSVSSRLTTHTSGTDARVLRFLPSEADECAGRSQRQDNPGVVRCVDAMLRSARPFLEPSPAGGETVSY